MITYITASAVAILQTSFSFSATKARDTEGDSSPQGLQIYARAYTSVGENPVLGVHFTFDVDVMDGETIEYTDTFTIGPTAGVLGGVRACPVETYPYNKVVQVTITSFTMPDGYVMSVSPPVSVTVLNTTKDGIASYCL